jgi:hypothetical protein
MDGVPHRHQRLGGTTRGVVHMVTEGSSSVPARIRLSSARVATEARCWRAASARSFNRMDGLPVARGAWLPVEAAAELFSLDVQMIRSRIADGSLEARTAEGIEFVRLAQLEQLPENGGTA